MSELDRIRRSIERHKITKEAEPVIIVERPREPGRWELINRFDFTMDNIEVGRHA